MNPARIFIAVPVHKRWPIAYECIRTLENHRDRSLDHLAIYNDSPKDISAGQLSTFADSVHAPSESIGIEAQRRRHIIDFWHGLERGENWSHLYLADSDAIHDVNFRAEMLRIQSGNGGIQLCGYNTRVHSDMPGNTIKDDPTSEIIIRHFAPGISYLLTRAHVEKIMPHIDNMKAFDWEIPTILGNRFAVTRTSYVEHVGFGGLHHGDANIEGGDRATNPTPYLVAKRAEIVAKLRKIYAST